MNKLRADRTLCIDSFIHPLAQSFPHSFSSFIHLSLSLFKGNKPCPVGWFRCRNNYRCIQESFKCDGNDDCRDNSDEDRSNCPKCGTGEWECDSGLWVLYVCVCGGIQTTVSCIRVGVIQVNFSTRCVFMTRICSYIRFNVEFKIRKAK